MYVLITLNQASFYHGYSFTRVFCNRQQGQQNPLTVEAFPVTLGMSDAIREWKRTIPDNCVGIP